MDARAWQALICVEDNEVYYESEILTEYYKTFYFNCDEKSGKADMFSIKTEDFEENNLFKRSDLRIAGTDRTIIINSAHPAYLARKEEPDDQRAYMKEQVLKQVMNIYIREGKSSVFNNNFESLDKLEASQRAFVLKDRMEGVFHPLL